MSRWHSFDFLSYIYFFSIKHNSVFSGIIFLLEGPFHVVDLEYDAVILLFNPAFAVLALYAPPASKDNDRDPEKL